MLGRVKREMVKRMESLTHLELYDKNLVRAVNCRVIPVAGYAMNICRFSKVQDDLVELDTVWLCKGNLGRRKSMGDKLVMKDCTFLVVKVEEE